VIPIGTSIKPTLLIFPASAKTLVPFDFSVPIEENHSAPFRIIAGMFAKVSTLFTLVAILRLAVPYTGMILTAREPAIVRDEIIQYGISQIDGGSKIELGSYSFKGNSHNIDRSQFQISDDRPLNDIIDELLEQDMIPSFCTACYRLGRTGEHFMEFSVPGFIKRFCTPNAILTLAEYLFDYAPEQTRLKGMMVIENNLKSLSANLEKEVKEKISRIEMGERDLYF
jgi:2-iminoacetate synthase